MMSFQNPTFLVQLELKKKKKRREGGGRRGEKKEREEDRACARGRLMNTESWKGTLTWNEATNKDS